MSTWSTAWLMVFSFQSQVGAFSCKSKMPLRVICKLVSTGLYCACPLVDIVPLTRTGSLCEYMMWLGSIRVLSIQYIFTYMKSSPAQAQEIICELPWCTYQLFMTTPFFADFLSLKARYLQFKITGYGLFWRWSFMDDFSTKRVSILS